MQRRVVARVERVDNDLAEAWTGKDDFRQHRVTDQHTQIEADDGYDRDQHIAQRMTPDDEPGRHAFGSRGADVVFAQRVQHARAGDAGDVGDHDDAEIDGGQRERPQTFQQVTGARRGDDGEPAHLDGEQYEQKHARYEGGE